MIEIGLKHTPQNMQQPPRCRINIATATQSRVAAAFFLYMPMQLVAPRAVTIAVAILAIICTMNLMVSLFVIPEPLSSRIGARWRLLMRSYYLP